MLGNKLKLKGILMSMMLLITVSSTGSVFAFGSVGTMVEGVCASAGNPLLDEFQNLSSSSQCTACHDNGGGGGSGGGKSASSGSDAAIIDFFCPPVDPPAPPVEPPVPPVEPPPPQTCTDTDGDGVFAEGGDCGQMDCNDNDPSIFPGAEENCGDGIDNNCNGLIDTADPNAMQCPAPDVCTDLDGDGYSIEGGSCGAMDCNDSNADLNPGASEACDDGIDNNCDGMVDSADVACQVMEEDEHRKKRHDHDRKECSGGNHDEDDDHDDDDDHEVEDDDDDDYEDKRQRRRKHKHDDD